MKKVIGYVRVSSEIQKEKDNSISNQKQSISDYCQRLGYELVEIFEDNGIKIVVDKKSLLYLVGTTLEYSGGLNGKGFVFTNPNANRTCGCGESFSL